MQLSEIKHNASYPDISLEVELCTLLLSFKFPTKDIEKYLQVAIVNGGQYREFAIYTFSATVT